MSTSPGANTFAQHTAVQDDIAGLWRARIAPELRGFGGAHGGYIAAIALHAMSKRLQRPERTPRSLTVRLLEPIATGYIEFLPRLERHGSSMSTLSLRIEQDGALVADAAAQFGRSSPAPAHIGLAAPTVPPPEACTPLSHKPAPEAQVGSLIEHRPAGPLPLSGSECAQIVVWMRLHEEHPLDALVATMLSDAAPPALYGRLRTPLPMPSAEIAIHYADPAALTDGPWLLGVFRTLYAGDGYAVEDGELWSQGMRLALQARQLRKIVARGGGANDKRAQQ